MESIELPCPAQDSFVKMFAKALLTPKRRPARLEALPRFVMERKGIRIRPEQLAAYREACGYSQEGPVPLLFPYVLTAGMQLYMLTQRRFPLPAFGMVHARNQITHHRQIDPGEVLDAVCRIGESRVVKSGLEFDMEASLAVGGSVVCENISTYLCRGKFGEPDPDAPRPSFSEIPPAAQSFEWKVPKNMGRRYARIVGDYNLIHISNLAAKVFGFPRAIIHGLWTTAVCAARLRGTALHYPVSCDVLFKGPVLIGSTAKARVEDSGQTCRFDVYCGSNPRPCLCGIIQEK
ncbi:MAG TPA: MaoC/PaaZ C-terminal domain-containing protein [Candidatus Hydrogenedentes bacterium]|nr:MaoC/PaaZ C-terminal domain-containing protein [Candidatus Hydrogenedentota bacterium]